jgi:Ca2+-binding EF-hand superfamily protein
MKLKLTLFTALAGLLTFSASAQDTQPPPGRPGGPRGEGRGRPQPSAEDIKKYDKDADGKLSEEEARTMRTERAAAREKEMLAKYDADKDGKLNDEERKKMETENPRRGPGGPGGRFQPTPEELKKYDADKDGKLNDEEQKTLREARQKEALEKYDADKDGKLSDEERQKMFEDRGTQRGRGNRPGSNRPGRGGDARPDTAPETPKIPAPETK